MEINLPHNWKPRDDQMSLWNYLENGGLRAVEVAHRQWGKDTVGMHFTCCAAHERIGNYWHMLPNGNQCRSSIWTAINPDTGILRIDEAFPLELRESTNTTEMRINFKCGSTYQLVGSDNFNKRVGAMPIGIMLSEWALANPMAWAYLGPILEKNGGWALFISTSRGRNHLQTLYEFAKREPGWFAELTKADKTNVFKETQLESIQRGYHAQFGDEMGEALFQQEYYCSFEGAVLGSYYGKQMSLARGEGRICKVPYQPSSEVYTYWDIGVDDSTSIWFVQHIGKSHHVIDYYENTGRGMDHYATVMKDKKYNYALNVMPHDANSREMTDGELAKSPKTLAENCGISPIKVVPRAKNMDVVVKVHIPAVRNLLSSCWFDEEKCGVGIAGLENYHAKYDETTKVLTGAPNHNWASHPSDAMRTMAVGYKDQKKVLSVGEYMDRMG